MRGDLKEHQHQHVTLSQHIVRTTGVLVSSWQGANTQRPTGWPKILGHYTHIVVKIDGFMDLNEIHTSFAEHTVHKQIY
jgi:hypothetical protein